MNVGLACGFHRRLGALEGRIRLRTQDIVYCAVDLVLAPKLMLTECTGRLPSCTVPPSAGLSWPPRCCHEPRRSDSTHYEPGPGGDAYATQVLLSSGQRNVHFQQVQGPAASPPPTDFCITHVLPG